MAMSNASPKFDTRGLPEGMDPLKFYEYRTLVRANEATGLEGLVYRLIPIALIQSFALAIDPFKKFKVSSRPITPRNRTRIKTRKSVLDDIRYHLLGTARTYRSLHNYQGIPGLIGPVQADPPVTFSDYYPASTRQEPLKWVSEDTTKKTRLMGSDQGELFHFRSTVSSPPRTVRSSNVILSSYHSDPPSMDDHDDGYRVIEITGSGASATFQEGRYNNLINSERDFLTALMQKEAPSILKGLNPQNRQYSLTRNIVELRDIPGSIRSLQQTLRHLSDVDRSLHTLSKLKNRLWRFYDSVQDIPKEYVGYHFGWKQTYNDILGLLATPDKISKKINLLIERSGKPTTFRSKRNYSFGESDVPGFDYINLPIENDQITKSDLTREVELRMVLNSTFDFPSVDLPTFREKFFLRQLGVVPTPTDLYNLVPWTWLVDWFTGLGNYVELIDEVNSDQSLVNFCFITGVTTGSITTTMKCRIEDYYASYYNGVKTAEVLTNKRPTHTSVLDFSCQLRQDVTNLLDVKTTADVSTLSLYQQSILGALLLQRTNFRR